MVAQASTARRLHSATAVVAVALGALLLAPGWAQADTKPVITSGPVITGTPRVGEALIARADWTGSPQPTSEWSWLRCAPARGPCSKIPGAVSDSYRVTLADLGSALRVRLELTNESGSADARSEPTAVVLPELTPPPGPTPEPTPEPTPTPSPTPSPVQPPVTETAPNAAFSPPAAVTVIPATGGAEQPTASAPRLLDPFPVIRIRGSLTSSGVRVTLLSVRAPRGVRIAVRCRGRSCPVPRMARSATVTRLKLFQRHLRAGTRLDITVKKRGYVGKWTTILIRRGLPPKRSDQCVHPGATRPAPCPSG